MAEPRFNFRLAPLLEHRKHLERDRKRKVAEIQQEINRLVSKVQSAQQAIAGENFTLTSERLAGKLDMAYISHQKRYVGSLQMLIMVTLQQMAAIERTLQAARKELLDAARARKVIEKLRERQFQRWLAEQNKKEAATIDEIGTQLAVRRMIEAEFAAAEDDPAAA